MSAQLPLALRTPADQRFDSYVGAADGALAQLQALARGDAADWIYLHGPAATGKTHLLLAACRLADDSGRPAAYLPLASAAGRAGDALAALHGHALVAIDGIEAIAGDAADELALFDFHNRAHDAGTGVLYAARAPADALPIALPDLRSRLAQCTRVSLQPLDDDGLRRVLEDRARRRGLQLDAAALDWLLKRVGRDLASLAALLDRLDRASLAAQRRLTVPFLRQVLGEDAAGA